MVFPVRILAITRPPEQKMRYPIARSLSSDKIGTNVVFGAENFGLESYRLYLSYSEYTQGKRGYFDSANQKRDICWQAHKNLEN